MVALLLRPLISLAVYLLAGTCVNALTVERAPPSPAGQQQQQQQQEWLITSSNSAEQVTTLHLNTSCPVSVTYEPHATTTNGGSQPVTVVASVRFMADVVIGLEDTPGALFLTTVPHHTPEQKQQPLLLIFYREPQIHTLLSTASGDVTVDDRILARNAPSTSLHIDVHGTGNLHVHAGASSSASSSFSSGHDFNVDHVALTTRLSGGITLATRNSITATTLEVTTTGSGVVSVSTPSITLTRNATVTSTSKSSVCLHADSFMAPQIAVTAVGSAEVTLSASTTRRCDACEYIALGTGVIHAGAIRCDSADVTVMGTGNVVVQAAYSLVDRVMGSGRVFYRGDRPTSLVETGLARFTQAAGEDIARPADAEDDDRQAICVDLRPSAVAHGGAIAGVAGASAAPPADPARDKGPYDKFDDDTYNVDDEGDEIVMDSGGADDSVGVGQVSVSVGLIAVVLALATVTVRNHHLRLQREQMPLLQAGDAPVYV